ncbi:hypothetical protein H072_598 [Dactylellina haptotyla CBS 200.50]|uniref:Major facilitator superfamily (MFS) profile domain-containing protein n=1 Tax=Dactylellina haptotyla (strain CBS 200.50) TaxID=1284197 RepID=S8AR33_DACHA|nr:hypothetical protein H072_598 [Dactylellina haptotyla CBS 200.50]
MSASNDEFEEIPGTEKIFEAGHTEILLFPHPTDSPNDPLNWGWQRRYWHALLVLFYTGFTAATANNAGSTADPVLDELGIGYDIYNDAAGVLFAGIGYFAPFVAALATLYGRRVGYLVSMVLGLIGSIWFAKVMTIGDTIGNQLFVGMSESGAETIVQLSLIDIFYSHRIGTALAIYILATSVGTYLGPLVGGYIAGGPLGWRWVPWLGVIFYAVSIVVFYFGLEETYFDRERYLQYYAKDTPGVAVKGAKTVEGGEKGAGEKSSTDNEDPEKKMTIDETTAPPEPLIQKGGDPRVKKTYWESIALITPASNLKGWGGKQYLQRLIQGFRVFAFPAVIFSGLQWGAQDAWLTFYLTTEDGLWYDEPYNYSNYGVALMNVPCLIGAIIGCMYAGPLSDWFVIWMAKRNNGVKEAEYRLYLALANLIISPAGLLIFGIGSARGWYWPRPYVGLGFIGFGWGCAGDVAMAYLVDCYPDMVIEGMVGVAVINNTLGMIFTFACSDFIDAAGTENSYIIIVVL